MFISDAAIKNRTTVLLLVVLIVFVGLISYFTLPREAAPDIPTPFVTVTTIYEGVSPEDIESSITMKIEQELTGLKGMKEITSVSREGVSVITIEFMPDVLTSDALQYVRDKVDQARAELPTEAEDPILNEINIAEFPIMMVDINGPVSMVQLKAIADELEDRIEAVPGVLDVDVLGAREREIRLEFDPDRVAQYNISIPELISLIPSENVNISAGGLETARTDYNVRVPAEFDRPSDVDHLMLTVRDGRPIYLSDVATPDDTFKDRESFSRTDGVESVTLAISKRTGANIITITDAVKEILEGARPRIPAGVDFVVTLDQSDEIRLMLADLENNILTALLLVVGVLMLALGFRTSLIVGLAIPLSMLMSLGILNFMGITLNMIVLFSLILALGMLVDNAIVIVENIYRYMQMGHGKMDAAMKGTSEVAWPVITSTATTLAAFAPMLLWQGIVGEFMKFLPITVITVLASSLFVAMVVSPVVASVLASPPKRKIDGKRENWFYRGYRWLLASAVHHWAVTLSLVGLLFVAMMMLYGKYSVGTRFFPDLDPDRGLVNIRCSQGVSVQHTNLLSMLAETRILPDADALELEHVNANVGSSGQAGFGGSSTGPHIANITLIFQDYEDRDFSETDMPATAALAEIRRRLADIPGAEIKVEQDEGGPPTGAPVTIELTGEDFQVLADLAERVKQMIGGVEGLVNLRSDYEGSRPELQFIVDRERAMLMNVDTLTIGQFLQTAVFGREVGTYREFNEEYDITVRLPERFRRNVDDLYRLRVPDAAGNPIPLSNLGELRYAGGYGQINRIDRKRVVTVTADVEGRQPDAVLGDVMDILTPPDEPPQPNLLQRLGLVPFEAKTYGDGLQLPEGYNISYAGEKEEQDKAMRFLAFAYAVALLAILMILVMQFNTLSAPLIIMVTVALSLIGVFGGLLITHTPFVVIMTGIGVISLAGVVVNNAIVLLDYTRQLQREGMGIYEAVLTAGQTRLRPVLLTAITTILGLVPMATGISWDFREMELVTRSSTTQWWSTMANAVIFGLAFSTVLTLVVVPTLYTSLYRLLQKLGLGGLRRGSEPLHHDAPPLAETVDWPPKPNA